MGFLFVVFWSQPGNGNQHWGVEHNLSTCNSTSDWFLFLLAVLWVFVLQSKNPSMLNFYWLEQHVRQQIVSLYSKLSTLLHIILKQLCTHHSRYGNYKAHQKRQHLSSNTCIHIYTKWNSIDKVASLTPKYLTGDYGAPQGTVTNGYRLSWKNKQNPLAF